MGENDGNHEGDEKEKEGSGRKDTINDGSREDEN